MKKILILVDMQNGFLKFKGANELIKNTKNLLSKNIFDFVIATKYINNDNSIYEKLFDWHEMKTKEEQDINFELLPWINILEEKNIYTCVNTNFIQKLIVLNNGEYPIEIYIAGVDTDCCVLKIATDLFENNIRPIVLTDCCYSNGGKEAHKAGLLCLSRLIGTKQILNK